MELINLQRLSAINITSIIWEKPDIKRQIRELFELKSNKELQIRELLTQGIKIDPTSTQKQDRYQNFQFILQSVLQHLNSIKLPLNLQNYTQYIASELGEKIYDWNEYVNDILKFNLKFTEKIIWSPHGTIDENKIFKSWKNDCQLLNPRNTDSITPAIYVIACINAQEDFIRKNQDKMEKLLKERVANFDLNNYHHKVYTLMSLTLSCHINRNCRENIIINTADLIISPVKMLQICAAACFPNAVYYYWKVLSDFGYKREYCLINPLDWCLVQSSNYWCNYKKTKLGEILTFLIGHMSSDQKIEFLQKNIVKVFCGILPAWPFNEQIMPLINEYLRNLTVEEYQDVAFCILHSIKENEGGSKIKYFCSVFKNIFTDLPKDTKNQIFSHDFLKANYYQIFCVECLILIFNNINSNERIEALKQIEKDIYKWASERNIEKLNIFVDKVLISDEERNYFKINVKNIR